MRVMLLTTGSRGDTQPYIALGVGLKRAAYAVRLPAHLLRARDKHGLERDWAKGTHFRVP